MSDGSVGGSAVVVAVADAGGGGFGFRLRGGFLATATLADADAVAGGVGAPGEPAFGVGVADAGSLGLPWAIGPVDPFAEGAGSAVATTGGWAALAAAAAFARRFTTTRTSASSAHPSISAMTRRATFERRSTICASTGPGASGGIDALAWGGGADV